MSTSALPVEQFAAQVRSRYPGAYDHIPDQELADKIVAKYPQYKDNILPAAGAAETIANIIPEGEAAEKTRQRADPTALNEPSRDFPGTPKMGAARNVEYRLERYNPAAQLATAAISAPSSVGLVRMGIANPVAAARMIGGSAAGSTLGGYGGRAVGGIWGDEGRKVGEEIGGVVGGLGGGYLGARGLEIPGRGSLMKSLFGGSEEAPKPEFVSIRQSPSFDPVAYKQGAAERMSARPSTIDPVRQAVREGRAALIPTRMPKLPAPEPEPDEYALGKILRRPELVRKDPLGPMPIEKMGPRIPRPMTPLVGTPEEVANYEQRMRILNQEAKDAGIYHAARGSTKRKVDLPSRIGKRMSE